MWDSVDKHDEHRPLSRECFALVGYLKANEFEHPFGVNNMYQAMQDIEHVRQYQPTTIVSYLEREEPPHEGNMLLTKSRASWSKWPYYHTSR